MYEETLTGRPHDTSVQKATSDNKNVNGCSLISCPGHHLVWMQFNVMPRTPPFDLNKLPTSGSSSSTLKAPPSESSKDERHDKEAANSITKRMKQKRSG